MRVVILGGGISGLSAAWYLLKKIPNAQITLFEKEERLGGWIESKQQGAFTFELGPRTFQTGRSPLLLQMVQELGLEVVYSASAPKFLLHQGSLRPLRSFWPQLAYAALRDLCMPRGKGQEETIYQFAARRMGKGAAELFFDPMAKGVYGGDIRKLSASASFPFLFKQRSLVLSMLTAKKEAGLFTLRRGMESLIDALKTLPIEIHRKAPVEEIRENGVVAKEKFWPADLIISSLPGLEIARLTKIPLSLRNEPISVVNFGYSGEILPKKGYGYLVPSREGEKILGQIWDTSIFPIPGQTKITSMVRGFSPLAIAKDALYRHLNVREEPMAIAMKEASIPQYDVGHISRIEAFEKEIASCFSGKLKLTGNYLHGASVEACLRQCHDLFQVSYSEGRN